MLSDSYISSMWMFADNLLNLHSFNLYKVCCQPSHWSLTGWQQTLTNYVNVTGWQQTFIELVLQVINNPSHGTNLTGWQQTFTNLTYRLTTNLHKEQILQVINNPSHLTSLTGWQQTFTITGWQLVKLVLWRFVVSL